MSTLTPTGRVILGMLRLGARTGYEIKQAVEVSTRFFWGASYGQIYPELKRLTEAGLLEVEDAPRGGVRRREYRLTAAGEQALHDWLTGTDWGTFEYRDELLLKFFFGDLLASDEARSVVRAMAERSAWIVARFREIDERARDAEDGERYPLLALEFGIGLMEWIGAWAAETEARLT